MTDTVLRIDYNELPVTDMAAAKAFYSAAFGWTFLDYGPTYAAFENAGIDGGLRLEAKPFPTGALILLRAEDILDAERRVEAAGGTITLREDYPGGRRFLFTDPSGNQLGIYSLHGKYG